MTCLINVDNGIVLRKLERIFFHAPLLNMDAYPVLDENIIARQKTEAMSHKRFLRGLSYVYLRFFNNGDWYIDLYYYTRENKGDLKQERFVVSPGLMMPEELEFRFMEVLQNDGQQVFDCVNDGMAKRVAMLAPDLNMRDYDNPLFALAHLYFASFRSGIRECLFKSGLDVIAMHLYRIDGLNLIGTNLDNTFEMPVALLRKLNNEYAVDQVLSSPKTRTVAKEVYMTYSSILNNIPSLNEVQIKYLWECKETGTPVDVKLLKISLSGIQGGFFGGEYCDAHQVYYDLMEYQTLVKKVNKLKKSFPKYPVIAPEEDATERFYEGLRVLREYAHNQKEIDEQMAYFAGKNRKRYGYENEKYIVMVPAKIMDIMEEAENMHNCLIGYIEKIVNGSTIILFIREKDAPKKSLLTVEVSGEQILQARAFANGTPSMEQESFLREFARAKALSYKDVGDARRRIEEELDNLPFQ